MLEKKIAIKNATGIHARPASLLVKEATRFKSDCFIIKGDKEYNCRSIMSIMGMGAKQGDEVILKVSGEDEQEAFEAISDLIERGFDE